MGDRNYQNTLKDRLEYIVYAMSGQAIGLTLDVDETIRPPDGNEPDGGRGQGRGIGIAEARPMAHGLARHEKTR